MHNRTLGIKFKSGASDEEVVQTYQNYQTIVLEELAEWRRLQEEQRQE